MSVNLGVVVIIGVLLGMVITIGVGLVWCGWLYGHAGWKWLRKRLSNQSTTPQQGS